MKKKVATFVALIAALAATAAISAPAALASSPCTNHPQSWISGNVVTYDALLTCNVPLASVDLEVCIYPYPGGQSHPPYPGSCHILNQTYSYFHPYFVEDGPWTYTVPSGATVQVISWGSFHTI